MNERNPIYDWNLAGERWDRPGTDPHVVQDVELLAREIRAAAFAVAATHP